MNQIEIGLFLLGMLSLLIGVPIICICCNCKPEIDSIKPLGKYLLK
jgi:hypothetical protein